MFSENVSLSDMVFSKKDKCDFFIEKYKTFDGCYGCTIFLYPEKSGKLGELPSFDSNDYNFGNVTFRLYDEFSELKHVETLAVKKFRNYQNDNGYVRITIDYKNIQKTKKEIVDMMCKKNATQGMLHVDSLGCGYYVDGKYSWSHRISFSATLDL